MKLTLGKKQAADKEAKNAKTAKTPKHKAAKPLKAPKKPLFSFGKKKLTPSATGADFAIDAAQAQADRMEQLSKIDTKRLLPMLVGALVLVLGLLLAKLFLFSDSDSGVMAPTIVPANPVPVETAESAPEVSADTQEAIAAPTEVAATDGTAMEAALSDTAPESATAQPATTEAPAAATEAQAPVANAGGAINSNNTPSTVPVEKLSYDDFLKETQNKVYRERNTTPSAESN